MRVQRNRGFLPYRERTKEDCLEEMAFELGLGCMEVRNEGILGKESSTEKALRQGLCHINGVLGTFPLLGTDTK